MIFVEEFQCVLESEQLQHLLEHFCIILADTAVSFHLLKELMTFADVLFRSLGSRAETDHYFQLFLSNSATDSQQTAPEFVTLAWPWLESSPCSVWEAKLRHRRLLEQVGILYFVLVDPRQKVGAVTLRQYAFQFTEKGFVRTRPLFQEHEEAYGTFTVFSLRL